MAHANLQAVRRGKPFTINDQTFIEVSTSNSHPLASVREAVMNSIESGAKMIDIFPNESEQTVIYDNGCGMSARELSTFLEGLGSGSKERGRTQNLGVGLKAVGAVQNPSGVVISSWKRRDVGHKIFLGRLDRHQYGMVANDTGDLLVSIDPPQYHGEELPTSGTEVVLMDTPFRPYEIRKFLNERLLQIPEGVEIRIWSQDGKELRPRKVIGAIAAMNRLCSPTGLLDLELCNVYWGIRRPLLDEKERASVSAFTANQFDGFPLYYAWNGEVYTSWELHRGGRQKLASWGVRAGAAEVMLIVEAKGDQIAPTLDRCDIRGWDEEEAQLELHDHIPDELLDFMTRWEERHFDKKWQEASIQLFLAEISSPVNEFDASSPGTRSAVRKPGEEVADRDVSEKSSKPRRRRRRGARALGRPGLEFVDSAELGNQPLAYDDVYNRVLINQQHSMFRVLKEAETPKLAGDVKTIVGGTVLHAFTVFVETYNDVPDDIQLTTAVMGALGLATYKVRNPRRFTLPSVKQK